MLALELKADVLLIDEKRGREIAEQNGLHCLGLAGSLLMAKQSALIASLRVVLAELETVGSFYLEESIKKHLLFLAGELKPVP